MKEDLKCVYIFEMSNNTIKIGVSNNVKRRIIEISCRTRLKVINFYNTKMFKRQMAFDIEFIFKDTFNDKRVIGEFFSLAFEDACAKLKKIIAEYKFKITYEKISIVVIKGKKAYYKQEASKRGLWLPDMIQKAIEEYLKNHAPSEENLSGK